ncbi:cutinase domain-containing protein [Sarocladium implicatum]|nr:cutinase domain-containing protein [Sarocladium implicatum]
MMIKNLTILAMLIAAAMSQECPEIPDNDIEIGEPVPIRPEDIPSGCSAFEILVARGTSEPNAPNGGKFGFIVGDPIVSNASAILPGVRGYPVQYPASASIVSGTVVGARDVADRISSQSQACPNQTFALVGYSQGAGVMHSAADRIPRALHSKVKSLVMFGDGYNRLGGGTWPSGLRNKVRQVCASGDPTCDRNGDCTYYHLTYIRPEYIDPAVEFIIKAFRS